MESLPCQQAAPQVARAAGQAGYGYFINAFPPDFLIQQDGAGGAEKEPT